MTIIKHLIRALALKKRNHGRHIKEMYPTLLHLVSFWIDFLDTGSICSNRDEPNQH